jgi:PST family polysaccharide transporter
VAQFGISVVLARLLPPEDFGLMGLAMVAVGFGNIFVKLGLGQALVQRQALTSRHVRVAFTTSVLMGGAFCALTYAAAPLIAQFFRDTHIVPILRVLSVMYVLAGLFVVSKSLLQRELSFQVLFYVECASAVLFYGGVGITMALLGFGVWSLVYAVLARRVAELILGYGFVRHPVRPLLSLKELRELASFGVGQSLARVTNYFAVKGDYFVVGRLLGPGPLGFYTRAYKLMKLPTSKFVTGLGSVLFPAASKIQHDTERFRRAYLYTFSVMSFVVLPATAALVSLAPELIVGIYGRKWMGSIVPLQILSAFGFFRATYNGAANFVRAKGWVYRVFLSQVVYGGCVLGGTWVAAAHFGLEGAAGAVGGSIFVMWSLMIYFGNRAAEASLRQLLSTVFPGTILSLPLVGACLASKWALGPLGVRPLGVVLVAGLLGLAGMSAALWYLPQWFFGHLPRRMLRSMDGAVPAWAEAVHRRLTMRFGEGNSIAEEEPAARVVIEGEQAS